MLLGSFRPFTRIQTVFNPEYNKLAKSILEDISFFISLEKLFYPTKEPIYNTKPLIKIFDNNNNDNSNTTLAIIENKKLSKLCNFYLVDNYYRDLTLYDKQNELLIARCWFNFDQHEKLLRLVNVYETIDYQKNIDKYMRFIDNTTHVPNFKDNKDFLNQLKHFHE